MPGNLRSCFVVGLYSWTWLSMLNLSIKCEALVSRWSHWIWVRLPVQSTSSLARFACLTPNPPSDLLTLPELHPLTSMSCALSIIASSVCTVYSSTVLVLLSFRRLYSSRITISILQQALNVEWKIFNICAAINDCSGPLIYQIPTPHHACSYWP